MIMTMIMVTDVGVTFQTADLWAIQNKYMRKIFYK